MNTVSTATSQGGGAGGGCGGSFLRFSGTRVLDAYLPRKSALTIFFFSLLLEYSSTIGRVRVP